MHIRSVKNLYQRTAGRLEHQKKLNKKYQNQSVLDLIIASALLEKNPLRS